MIFLPIKKIESIHHEFKMDAGALYLLKKEGGIEKLNETFELVWSKSDNLLYNLSLWKDILTVGGSNGEIHLLSKNKGELIKSFNRPNIYFNPYNQHCFKFEKETGNTALFDLSTEENTWVDKFRIGSPYYTNKDILVFNTYLNKQLFEVRSIESGALLWRYDVTEIARWRQFPSDPERPGEVRKFIGVWQDELLVALTNHTIIALDIHTGELKRKWRDVPEEKWRKIPFIGSSNHAAAIPYPEGTVLDSEGGKLVGASYIFFWEIDLHTGALLFEEFSAEFGTPLNEVQYSIARGKTPALSGDHLFLIGERYHSAKNGNDSEVIAFNRKTHTIDWRHTFPLEEGVQFGLHSPVLEGNRLYVLDNSGTLYIFERTN